MNDIAQEPDKKNALALLRKDIDNMHGQFAAALPTHIPVERFARSLMTAIQNNPDLIHADRRSLFNSAMKAAQDGLLPDGREGAIVIYRSKERVRQDDGTFKDRWINKAQWMPMVFGIMKKARNSGEIASIGAFVVYGGDNYKQWIDDAGEHMLYEPCENPDTEVVRRIVAFAKLKDGTLKVESLSPSDVEKIREVSRAKDSGPWVSWWSEMARKSAIRRLSKYLPTSSDLDDLIRRDDNLYDFDKAREEGARRQGLANKLDVLAGLPSQLPPQPTKAIVHNEGDPVQETGGAMHETEGTVHDQDGVVLETGEPADGVSQTAQPSEAGRPQEQSTADPATPSNKADKAKATDKATSQAADRPETQGAAGPSASSSTSNGPAGLPTTEAEYAKHAEAWIDSLTDVESGDKRWAEEKGLRNKSNTGGDAREALQERLKKKQAELRKAAKNGN